MNPDQVSLLPAGLVEPASKVLSISGDGPFGLSLIRAGGDAQAKPVGPVG